MQSTNHPHLTDAEWDRFLTKFHVQPNGCWTWNGPLDRDGYGAFFLRKKNRRAHRVGWFALHGGIADGMVINHKCRNRACVNPQHLEMITVRENSLHDSAGLGALNARKTHCKNGHPFDRVYGGQRYCSVCESAKSKRLRASWAAEAAQTAC